MWIVHAIFTGIFIALSSEAYQQGMYDFALVFGMVAVAYCLMGLHELRKKK